MTQTKTKILLKAVLPVLGLAALVACSASLLPPPKEAPRLFTLKAEAPAAAAHSAPVSLQVVLPQAEPGLDTDRIALFKGGHEMNYYDGAKWSGTLSAIVQSQIVDAFGKSQSLKAVGSDTIAFQPDDVLLVDIADFQAEYAGGGAPVVHVRLIGYLTDKTSRQILSTRTYEEKEPAGANEMDAVVTAYNKAFSRAVGTLVTETAEALAPK